MKLLTADLRAKIPPLYSQENLKFEDRIVHAKFFFPAGNWTWYITEGEQDGDDFRMFGFVIGFEKEWGYVSLNELQSINVNGLTVERDLYFDSGKFSDVIAREHGF